MTQRASWLAGALAFTARLVSGATAKWHAPLDGRGQRIFYANHTSHLDSVVVWSLLPSTTRVLTRPIAAEDYWGHDPIRRTLARDAFNAILIPRRASGVTDPDAIRVAAQAAVERTAFELGDRFSAIIFPEGTRGDGDEVAPFKTGLFYLCEHLPSVELVPVYIENLNRILPKGALFPVPLLTSVTFGAPLRRLDDEGRDEFLTRLRDALVGLGPV